MKSQSESYKEAGVDITSGYRAVELMKEHVSKTMVFGNTSPVGGFGGLLQPDLTGMEEPILVSGTDGVGTKLKLAFLQDKHDTVGLDCVAMCVNDIICVGAKPLFFLDYIAVGKNVPEKVASIVKGVAEGCIQSECCLSILIEIICPNALKTCLFKSLVHTAASREQRDQPRSGLFICNHYKNS